MEAPVATQQTLQQDQEVCMRRRTRYCNNQGPDNAAPAMDHDGEGEAGGGPATRTRTRLRKTLSSALPYAKAYTTSRAERSKHLGLDDGPPAHECTIPSITGVPCGVRCAGFTPPDAVAVRVPKRLTRAQLRLEVAAAEHGEDGYTSLVRAAASAALGALMARAREFDSAFGASEVAVRAYVAETSPPPAVAADKLRRYAHNTRRWAEGCCVRLCRAMRTYLLDVEHEFVRTIEAQEGVAELEARLTTTHERFVEDIDRTLVGQLRNLRTTTEAFSHQLEKSIG
ncbi:hypothetical protein Q8F55_008548 [Vanrija albida]|uniref:Uncharacterized protein n=1 Tax=Vanrija albida TaxID=181172 RepID=A0ABR3PR63_9TREE